MRRLASAVAVALLLTLPGSVLAPAAAGQKAAVPPAVETQLGGRFSLLDHDGRRRSDGDFRGTYQLIYFGYTYCPTICPTGLETISQALDLLGDAAERVQPIFITIDPARDDVTVVRDYVRHFHPRLLGLTGSEAEIAAVARAYRVHRRKVVLEDSPGEGEGADDYLVDHSSITHLMGPDGKFLTLFPHGTDAQKMAAALESYLD